MKSNKLSLSGFALFFIFVVCFAWLTGCGSDDYLYLEKDKPIDITKVDGPRDIKGDGSLDLHVRNYEVTSSSEAGAIVSPARIKLQEMDEATGIPGFKKSITNVYALTASDEQTGKAINLTNKPNIIKIAIPSEYQNDGELYVGFEKDGSWEYIKVSKDENEPDVENGVTAVKVGSYVHVKTYYANTNFALFSDKTIEDSSIKPIVQGGIKSFSGVCESTESNNSSNTKVFKITGIFEAGTGFSFNSLDEVELEIQFGNKSDSDLSFNVSNKNSHSVADSLTLTGKKEYLHKLTITDFVKKDLTSNKASYTFTLSGENLDKIPNPFVLKGTITSAAAKEVTFSSFCSVETPVENLIVADLTKPYPTTDVAVDTKEFELTFNGILKKDAVFENYIKLQGEVTDEILFCDYSIKTGSDNSVITLTLQNKDNNKLKEATSYVITVSADTPAENSKYTVKEGAFPFSTVGSSPESKDIIASIIDPSDINQVATDTTEIVISFDKEVNSVSSGTITDFFAFTNAQGKAITFQTMTNSSEASGTFDEVTLTIASNSFAPASDYKLSIKEGLVGPDNTKVKPVTFTLKTVAEPEKIVTAKMIKPVENATEVALDSDIQIQFSGAIKWSEISKDNYAEYIDIKCVDDAYKVADYNNYSYDTSKKLLTISPIGDLKPNKNYSISISSKINAEEVGFRVKDYIASFTTKNEIVGVKVTKTYPESLENFRVDNYVILKFEPGLKNDEYAINDSVKMYKLKADGTHGSAIDLTLTYNPEANTLNIKPNNDLESNSKYVICFEKDIPSVDEGIVLKKKDYELTINTGAPEIIDFNYVTYEFPADEKTDSYSFIDFYFSEDGFDSEADYKACIKVQYQANTSAAKEDKAIESAIYYPEEKRLEIAIVGGYKYSEREDEGYILEFTDKLGNNSKDGYNFIYPQKGPEYPVFFGQALSPKVIIEDKNYLLSENYGIITNSPEIKVSFNMEITDYEIAEKAIDFIVDGEKLTVTKRPTGTWDSGHVIVTYNFTGSCKLPIGSTLSMTLNENVESIHGYFYPDWNNWSEPGAGAWRVIGVDFVSGMGTKADPYVIASPTLKVVDSYIKDDKVSLIAPLYFEDPKISETLFFGINLPFEFDELTNGWTSENCETVSSSTCLFEINIPSNQKWDKGVDVEVAAIAHVHIPQQEDGFEKDIFFKTQPVIFHTEDCSDFFGIGTVENPYLMYEDVHFTYLNDVGMLDKVYKLARDIKVENTLSQTETTPFAGQISGDENAHTITVNIADGKGMFAKIKSPCIINNIVIGEGSSVSGTGDVGIICGTASGNATIALKSAKNYSVNGTPMSGITGICGTKDTETTVTVEEE